MQVNNVLLSRAIIDPAWMALARRWAKAFALIFAIGVGMVFLAPSLWLLFYVFKGRNPAAT